MKCWSLGLAGALCAFGAFAAAEPQAGPAQAGPAPRAMFAASSVQFAKRLTPEQREEWRFLKDAAAQARFEYDASRIALAKSNDANVRSLAAVLVDHHKGSLDSLQRMLRARSMAPPMLSNDQRKTLTRMGKLQSPRFDRVWMERVALRSQQESVIVFERAVLDVPDPELRDWTQRTLPILREQLATAERIASGTPRFAGLLTNTQRAVYKASARETY